MDKSSNFVKIEKIRSALELEHYSEALKIAKTVDVAKLKNASDISVIAEAYYKNGDCETALLYFERIYQKKKTRRILISLINLCLKLSMADLADSYLGDFEEMAPSDFYCYIFRYQIDKMRQENIEVLIYDLEQLKALNYMENWAYELAKLYHKNGQIKECVKECDDIILWFGKGTYVERARRLRAVNLAGQKGAMTDSDKALLHETRARIERSGMEGTKGERRGSQEESIGREQAEEGISEKKNKLGLERHAGQEGRLEKENEIAQGARSGDEDDFAQERYSEEEYHHVRYGEPVYQEEGKDVIWYTKEFGPITEEMIQRQNTMDLLQGMQVAEQIRMHLGKNREMQVEGQQEQIEEWQRQMEERQRQIAQEEQLKRQGKEGRPERIRQQQGAKESIYGSVSEVNEEERKRWETGLEFYAPPSWEEMGDEIGGGSRKDALMKKGFWRRRKEKKERKKKDEAKTGFEKDERIDSSEALEQEAEENLRRMLFAGEPEQERELSKAVQSVTEESGSEKEAKGAKGSAAVKMREDKEEPMPEAADLPAQQEEGEIHIFEYPDMLQKISFTEESGAFYRRLIKSVKCPEEFFAEFLISAECKRRILGCMERIFEQSNQNIAVIISGDANSGKTYLAKAVAKCLQVLGIMTSPRVAVIRGRKLNRIRLEEKKDQLKDTTLIIEAASEMLPSKVMELLSMREAFAGTTAVILEDERGKINRLLAENEELKYAYHMRIDLPGWMPEDLFLQALAMLAAKEFQMEKSVAEQFLENIRKQIAEHPENSFDAMHIYTEQVIRNAEKRMATELKTALFEGRYADADFILLKAEDL